MVLLFSSILLAGCAGSDSSIDTVDNDELLQSYLEELEREEVQGVYIRDLMREEGETDVARL